ncbi:unnamed protein product [Rhizophagus irregularis]|nr:unnamed protein product [Rhizophagus irregularis]
MGEKIIKNVEAWTSNTQLRYPCKKSDPCFIFQCFFRECIIFMELIALNHGNFHLANMDIRECIIFTEFLRKSRRNNGNIRIKIFYRITECKQHKISAGLY